MKVTSRNIRSLPAGIHRLDNGIYLRVTAKNNRSWFFKYQKDGVRHEVGLGGIDQSLEGVRAKAAEMRTHLSHNRDPLAQKAQERIDKIVEAEDMLRQESKPNPTFADIYKPALKQLAFLRQWKTKSTEREYWRRAERYFLPKLRHIPLTHITPAKIASILHPLWTTQTSAVMSLAVIRNIMGYAKVRGMITSNPAEWRGNLDAFLPAPTDLLKGKPQKHHAAVTAEDLRDVVKALRAKDCISAKCALFGILTVCRLSEFRCAQWDEIDTDNNTLVVPPERRKDCKPIPFVVPLSRQAQKLLDEIPVLNRFIFTDGNAEKCLCSPTVWMTLKRATKKDITVHGTRSTFSDWCALNDKPFIVSEKCLMHAVGNKVFMAYQRDDLLDKRRKLLQEWADYLYADN